MLPKIAILTAKIISAKNTCEKHMTNFRETCETLWRNFTSSAEKWWSRMTSFVEMAWSKFKTAVENFWKSIFEQIETVPEMPEAESGEQRIEESTHRKIGLNIGLLYIDKKNYGTDGYCPGSDKDAVNFNSLLKSNGFQTTLLLNNEATWENVKNTVKGIAEILEAGDLFVLTAAGHGGQLKDTDGDEQDGYDETWLLYDKEVRDDEIFKNVVSVFKPGVRLVFINDQCHSESSFRSVSRALKQMMTFGICGKLEATPLVTADENKTVEITDKDGNTEAVRIKDTLPSLIQFAGCREGSVSYGGNSGGEWSSALIKTYNRKLTWKEWFSAAKKIPKNQSPQWVELGNVTDDFRNRKALN